MRFVPILLSLLAFSFASNVTTKTPYDVEGSGEEELLGQYYDGTLDRMKYYNWDYKDLSTSAFETLHQDSREPTVSFSETTCPDGWFHFSDSCYYIESALLGFAKAEKRCFEKKATLFVANSAEEWDAIREHAPKGYFSWIGLVRFSQYEKHEEVPRWQTEGGLNPTKLNWLIKPYQPITSGWSSLSNCVTHYNPLFAPESGSYTYYYPCVSLFHSICERNATLIRHENAYVRLKLKH